jgi:hypothetical protein
MPPTKVYKATPTGSRKVAAMICMPVIAVMAADAPRSLRTGQCEYFILNFALYLHVCHSKQVVDETEEHVHDMRGRAISNAHDLQQGVCFRDLALAADTQYSEEDDHGTASCSKPKWTGYSVNVPDETRGEHCSAP